MNNVRIYTQEIHTCYECPYYFHSYKGKYCTAFEEDKKIYDSSILQYYCPLPVKQGSEEVVDRRRDFHIYYYYRYVFGVPPWQQKPQYELEAKPIVIVKKKNKKSIKKILKKLIKNNKIKINKEIYKRC